MSYNAMSVSCFMKEGVDKKLSILRFGIVS
jgi:hypothetical protein